MKAKILVCTSGKHCKALGSKKIYKHLKLQEETLEDKCHFKVKKSDCLGYCKHAPAIYVGDNDKAYKRVDINICDKIIAEIAN